jgi:trk system potassium uptake protein TrkA
MRAIVVGCGRVGAGVAERLARAGHEVTVLDTNTDAFNRLPADFPGSAVRGDGTDEDILRRAGAQGADWFFALTEGDNRNILAAQLANETLGIPEVVAKVNDPVRAEAYTTLGLNTICRTTILIDALARFAALPSERAEVGVARATGHHQGGEHHAVRAPDGRRGDLRAHAVRLASPAEREASAGASDQAAAGDAADGAAGAPSGDRESG